MGMGYRIHLPRKSDLAKYVMLFDMLSGPHLPSPIFHVINNGNVLKV